MSDTSEFRCPNCGAPLSAQGEAATVQCAFCGTQAIVPEELRLKPGSPPAPPPPVTLPGWEEAIREAEAARANRAAVGDAARTRPRRRSSGLGCLFLIAVIVGLSLILRVFPGSAGVNSLVSTITGTPTPTVQPIQRSLASDLPRTLRYAGFTFHVTRGVIDNQAEQNSQVVYLPGKAFARLDLDMENTTREDLYLDAQLFQLKLGDGKTYPADQDLVLNSSFVAPHPGASGSTQLVFAVPVNAAWDGAALVVGKPDSEPEELPLTGANPSDPYPQQVAISQGLKAAAQGMTYDVLSATLDLNSGSQRAAKGKRFIILNLRMTNTDGKYGLNISSDTYRLTVAGVTQAPVSAPIEVVDYQTSMERQVVFMIPAEATSARLQLGDVRSEASALANLDLDLSKTTH